MRGVFDRETNEQRILKKAEQYTRGVQKDVIVSMPSDSASTASAAASEAEATASTVAVESADAGASYTAAEQTLVNEMKGDMNTLVSDLNAAIAVINALAGDHNDLVAAFTTLKNDHNDLVTRYNTLLANTRAAGYMA